MSLNRRLRVLEGRLPAPEPEDRSEVRAWIRKSLDQIVKLRRGQLGPEEEAEVRALIAAVERRREERRGEGGS